MQKMIIALVLVVSGVLIPLVARGQDSRLQQTGSIEWQGFYTVPRPLTPSRQLELVHSDMWWNKGISKETSPFVLQSCFCCLPKPVLCKDDDIMTSLLVEGWWVDQGPLFWPVAIGAAVTDQVAQPTDIQPVQTLFGVSIFY
jgi:hypothetical protein